MEGDQGRDGARHAGFHLDAFLSPFESLRTIVRQWKRADAHRKQTGSMAEVISFQTGRLAIPYKPEAAQGVTPEALRTSCREDYDVSIVPAGASVLIGAVDTQDNRLEAEVSAWGLVEVARDDASQLKGWGSHEFRGLQHGGRWYRLRRWALEYRRFHGDPGTPEIWEQLAKFMERATTARDRPAAAPRHDRHRHRRPLHPASSPISARCGAMDISLSRDCPLNATGRSWRVDPSPPTVWRATAPRA